MVVRSMGSRSTAAKVMLPLAALGVLLGGCQGAMTSDASSPTPVNEREATATATSSQRQSTTDSTATPTPADRFSAGDHGAIRVRHAMDAASPISGGGDVSTFVVGEPFILDGASSLDDGVVRDFKWTQVDGPYAFITDASSPTPFVVPSQPGTYAFELVVFGAAGKQGGTLEVKVEKNEFKQEFGPVQANRARIASGGTIPLDFVAFDTAANLASIEVEFSTDGGSTWQAATLVGSEEPRESTDAAIEATTESSSATSERATSNSVDTTPTPGATPTPHHDQDAILVGIVPTPSVSQGSSDHGNSEASSVTSRRLIWDSRSELGTTAREVQVRGWDPVKKQPIDGVVHVYYDPAIDEVSSNCLVHADLWRLDPDITPIRNRVLDACARHLLGELVVNGALTREQEEGFGHDLDAYDDVAFNPLATGGAMDRAFDQVSDQLDQLRQQDMQQRESQLLQLISNILKARHDTAMNAIRNMKA